MSVVIHDEGELQNLQLILSNGIFNLRLFKNDITPGATTPLGSFVEADFQDYAAVSIGWATPGTVAGKAQVAALAAASFVMGTPGTTNNIYGWHITEDSGGKVVASERYADAPRAMATLGSTITELPTLQLFG